MKNLTCSRCGGIINPKTYQCEYCGTYFEKPNNPEMPLRVLSVPTNVIPLQTEVAFDKDWFMTSMDMGEYVYGTTADRLAHELVKYMDFKITENPPCNQVIAKGKVRVVLPEYCFDDTSRSLNIF